MFYLAIQIRNQTKENRRARETEDKRRKEEEIRRLENELTLHLPLFIQRLLEKNEKNYYTTIKESLTEIADNENTRNNEKEMRSVATMYYDVVALWVMISRILSGLKELDELRYNYRFTIVIAQIDFKICTLLDELANSLVPGEIEYHFSTKKKQSDNNDISNEHTTK